MRIVLPAVAITFAAFCVWLTVRIINRRERWARWTGLALIVVLVLYPLSSGPATWIVVKAGTPSWLMKPLGWLYAPIHAGVDHGPDWLQVAFSDWHVWWIERAVGALVYGESADPGPEERRLPAEEIGVQ
jgi:hypothetical protein